jgi:hypothetical protein
MSSSSLFSLLQLQMAVKSGHIHVGVLHRPLSQNTLMLINQLLHSIQKSDQAASELHQLDEHPHSNAAIQVGWRSANTANHDILNEIPLNRLCSTPLCDRDKRVFPFFRQSVDGFNKNWIF